MRRFIIVFVLFLCSETFAQYNPVKISSDNKPSTIYQSNPRIYQKPDGNYIAAWVDMREGNSGYFAQEFTEDFLPVGKNVRTYSNLKRVYLSNDDYVMLGETSEYSRLSDITTYSLNAYIKQSGNESKILIGSSWMPFCGTGWLGISNDLVLFQDSFIFAYRFSEELKIYRYDFAGTQISSKILTGYESENYNSQAVSVQLVSLPEVYIVSWASCEFNMTNIKFNYNIYNSNDSLIFSKTEFDSSRVDDYYSLFENDNTHKIAAVDDTSFIFAFFDSLDLKLLHLSVDGNLVNSYTYTIDGDFSYEFYYSLNSFCLSIVDNTIKLLLQIQNYQSATGIEYKEYLIDLDISSGVITDKINIVNGANYYYGEEILSSTDNTLLAGLTSSSDVYAVKVKHGEIVDSLKLNNDSEGSNENNTLIVSGDNGFLCSWQDEQGSVGLILDNEGNKISSQINVDRTNYQLLGNNEIISLDRSEIAGKYYLTLGIRNSEYDLIAEYPVLSESTLQPIVSNFIEKEQSIYFAIGLQNKYRIFKHDKVSKVLSEKNFEYESNIYSLKFHESLDDLWLSVNFTPIRLNKDLEVILTGNRVYYQTYISPGTFITNLKGYSEMSYLQTQDYLNDTLSTCSLESGIIELLTVPLRHDEFAAIYLKDSKINLQVFNTALEPVKQRIILAEVNQIDIKNISAAANNEKLFITYSGRETEHSNYDIFAIPFGIDEITSMELLPDGIHPQSYKLMNNYPNPFNPSTEIEFTLPEYSHASLSIFNSLGEEIGEILNKNLAAGKYKVKFNATGLPSGVYIYLLKAGPNQLSKKMLLLK